MRLPRLLRLGALAIGYPLVVVLLVALLALGVRLVQVQWLGTPRDAEHLGDKLRYLDSLPSVDPDTAPNFVVVLFDDLGWGDLSVQGNRLIDTPRIDRAAAEGVRLTNFYSASSACTASRASLLTGRYPPRAGVSLHVFFPEASWMGLLRRVAGLENELPADELLLPEVLQSAGYATGMVGKWHLGETAGHRPLDRGFDEYFGLLWSNDMAPLHLVRGDEIIEHDRREAGGGERDEERPSGPGGVDQASLTQRYTNEAIAFLERNRDTPFFLYVAHSFPHVPLYPSPQQAGLSEGGIYGDVVEDLDRSTGALLDAIERLGLERETLVLITSDNGADYGGSPGFLRGRKGEILEGGQRVPFIARWPDEIPAGQVSAAMAMNIDFLPTLLALAGLPLPEDRLVDGRDLMPVLQAGAPSPHERLYYFPVTGTLPDAVRDARFKLLRSTGDWGRDRPHLTRLAFDQEAHDLRRRYPEVTQRLTAALQTKRQEFERNPRGWRVPLGPAVGLGE